MRLYCAASHLGLHGLAFLSRKGKENLDFKGIVRMIQNIAGFRHTVESHKVNVLGTRDFI